MRQPRATAEQFELFKRYLESRHAGGGMNQMSFVDYEYMVEDTPVQTVLVEYRLASHPQRPLVAVALTDVMPDGLSMVYSFYDPALDERGLGNLLILDHIAAGEARGADLRLPGLLGEGLAQDGLQGRSSARWKYNAARWAGVGWNSLRFSAKPTGERSYPLQRTEVAHVQALAQRQTRLDGWLDAVLLETCAARCRNT